MEKFPWNHESAWFPNENQAINDKHLKLLEVIAEDIGYKKIRWDDIKQYYYPIGLSNLRQDEAVLRRVQIDAGLAQINESKKHEEVSQANANSQMATQVLIEAMRNPDSLLKLMEVAEKAQNLNKGTKRNAWGDLMSSLDFLLPACNLALSEGSPLWRKNI